jgi:hypothetical protein
MNTYKTQKEWENLVFGGTGLFRMLGEALLQ